MAITIPIWFYPEVSGYEPQTTFWADFSIADAFGEYAVKDTFNRSFACWKTNVKYLTELALVLNHKAWEHNGRNESLSIVYVHLYDKVDAYALKHLKGADLRYYLNTLD